MAGRDGLEGIDRLPEYGLFGLAKGRIRFETHRVSLFVTGPIHENLDSWSSPEL